MKEGKDTHYSLRAKNLEGGESCHDPGHDQRDNQEVGSWQPKADPTDQ